MSCATCGHPATDHDLTFRMCNQEQAGTHLPLATRCSEGCMQYTTPTEEA